LGQIGDAQAVEPLISALNSSDWQVPQTAAQALGQIGDVRAVEPLISILQNNRTVYMRQTAAQVLGQIGDAQAVEPLTGALKDPDWQVRQATAQALETLNWQPKDNSQRALRSVALQKWEEAILLGVVAVEPLESILRNDKSLPIRLACYSALERLLGYNFPEADVQALVEAAVEKLQSLNSRTKTYTSESSHREPYDAKTDHIVTETVTVSEPDPDMEGIRSVVELMPPTLQERIMKASKEAQSLILEFRRQNDFP
jgi:HEAT repeat protein